MAQGRSAVRRVLHLSAQVTEGKAVGTFMGGRLTEPRVPRLTKDQAKALGVNGGPPIYLANHPDFVKAWNPWGAWVAFESTLGTKEHARYRNLAIARTGWLSKCEAVWMGWINMGHTQKKGPLSAEDVEALMKGPGDAYWASRPVDKAAISAADELRDVGCVSDETWAALGTGMDELQRVDLVAAIGQYTLNSSWINTLGALTNWPANWRTDFPAHKNTPPNFQEVAGRKAGPVPPEAPRPMQVRVKRVEKELKGGNLNVVGTLLRHKEMNKRWGSQAGHVMGEKNTLGPRLRELAIMRIGWLLNSKYEWHQHVHMSKEKELWGGPGLMDEDHHCIEDGPASPHWNAQEAVLLRAVDELRADAFLSDATWEELGKYFTLQQKIDLIGTVGNYGLVSFMLNSFGVELEDWIVRYDSKHGRFKQGGSSRPDKA